MSRFRAYFANQDLDSHIFPNDLGSPLDSTVNTRAQSGADNDDKDEYLNEERIQKRHKRASKAKDTPREKRVRLTGGRPATSKKVTADLDSDDELIMRMKEAKWLEKDIAQRLANEGRMAYHPKTIGTRWTRIKKAMAKRQDELLDNDQSDWHEGDDEALVRSIHNADEDVRKAIAEIEAKRWRFVAKHMKTLKPVTNFSQNACRQRYDDLVAGTAKPVPESILNPDESTLASISRRKSKEQAIIAQSNILVMSQNVENLKGNSWTSRNPTDL